MVQVRKFEAHRSLPRRPLRAFLSAILYHLHTAYLFTSSDLEAIVVTGYLFGAFNSQAAPLLGLGTPPSLLQVFHASPFMILWSWCVLLLTTLHNQRHQESIAEDIINKPWRPLAAGRVAQDQAVIIMYCTYPLCLAVSWAAGGGMIPFLVIAAFCIWYNELGGASDGFLKNFHNGVAIAAFLAGPLEIATGSPTTSAGSTAISWLAMLACAIGCTIHVQDLRDMEGDAAVGRKTVPLVIGEMNARVLVAAWITFWTVCAGRYWEARWTQVAWPGAFAAALIFSMFYNQTRKGDAGTYRLWPPWLLGLTLVPFFKCCTWTG